MNEWLRWEMDIDFDIWRTLQNSKMSRQNDGIWHKNMRRIYSIPNLPAFFLFIPQKLPSSIQLIRTNICLIFFYEFFDQRNIVKRNEKKMKNWGWLEIELVGV
jgi:hypothetical protein